MYTNALKKHSTPFANWFIGKLLFAIKKSTFNNSNTKKYTAKKKADLLTSTIVEGLNLLTDVMQSWTKRSAENLNIY